MKIVDVWSFEHEFLFASLKDQEIQKEAFKGRLSPFKKSCFICFNENPLKMMKNTFYFILKALFVVKILKYLSWLVGHVEKSILPNISQSKGNQTMKLGQLIECK